MFDIGVIADSTLETANMEIIDPRTGKGTHCFLIVASVDSQHSRDVEIEVQTNNILEKPGEGAETADYIAYNIEIQKLVVRRRVVGWENMLKHGAPLEFSQEALNSVLDSCPWLVDQLQIFASRRGNFFKKI